MAKQKSVLVLECPVCGSKAHVAADGETDWFAAENPAPVPEPTPDPAELPEPVVNPNPEPTDEPDTFLGNW